jgi:hypothetical protein
MVGCSRPVKVAPEGGGEPGQVRQAARDLAGEDAPAHAKEEGRRGACRQARCQGGHGESGRQVSSVHACVAWAAARASRRRRRDAARFRLSRWRRARTRAHTPLHGTHARTHTADRAISRRAARGTRQSARATRERSRLSYQVECRIKYYLNAQWSDEKKTRRLPTKARMRSCACAVILYLGFWPNPQHVQYIEATDAIYTVQCILYPRPDSPFVVAHDHLRSNSIEPCFGTY